MLRQPKVGDIVLFTSNPDDSVARSNHNTEEIPAIVTRVWSDVCVNVKIVPDCGAMQDRTSVVHFSINPAGYHFRFHGEEKFPTSLTAKEPNEDSADASTFLKSNQ